MNETYGSLKQEALRAGEGKFKQTTIKSICIEDILTRIYQGQTQSENMVTGVVIQPY